MASASEIKTESVVIVWRIEKINNIESPWWKSGISFKWPISKSRWIMHITLSDVLRKKFYISVRKRDQPEPFQLKGAVSILTPDDIFHNLAEFESHDFKLKDLKTIEVKNLLDFSFIKGNALLSDTLTLRICLTNPSAVKSILAEYSVYSRYTEQRCSFEWTVQSCIDSDGNELFSKYVIEPPRYFANFPCMEFLDIKITLSFEHFLTPYTLNYVQIKYISWYKYPFHAKLKLLIKDAKGNQVPFAQSDWLYFTDKSQYHRFPTLMDVRDFKRNKQLYYPKGDLNLSCDMSLTSYSPGIIEDVCESSIN